MGPLMQKVTEALESCKEDSGNGSRLQERGYTPSVLSGDTRGLG